jgi:hypothetical protein
VGIAAGNVVLWPHINHGEHGYRRVLFDATHEYLGMDVQSLILTQDL